MEHSAESILPMVCIGLIWINVLILFAVIITWLVKFSRLMSKAWKAWRAHPSTNSEEERGYAIRLEFAKLVLIVLFLITLVVFIPIMGLHNGNVLASYNEKRDPKTVGKCTILPNTWIWDRINEHRLVGWLTHSEWQPFGVLAMISFEMILLQLITSQGRKSKRIFTWQVKGTAIVAILEFLAILLLNCFTQSMFIGHSLFVFLAQIHLFIIDFCLIRIYCLMRKQIADLSHLKSREYYAGLSHKLHYECFIIPMVILLQFMLIFEMIFVVSIVVDTLVLNSCWVKETFIFMKYDIPEQIPSVANYCSNLIFGVNLGRQSLGLFVIWYLLLAQCVYSYREWKREKSLKRTSSDCVMQDSNDIARPLIANESRINN